MDDSRHSESFARENSTAITSTNCTFAQFGCRRRRALARMSPAETIQRGLRFPAPLTEKPLTSLKFASRQRAIKAMKAEGRHLALTNCISSATACGPGNLTTCGGDEVHLDRKLERMLPDRSRHRHPSRLALLSVAVRGHAGRRAPPPSHNL
jgi:hypothetical protein